MCELFNFISRIADGIGEVVGGGWAWPRDPGHKCKESCGEAGPPGEGPPQPGLWPAARRLALPLRAGGVLPSKRADGSLGLEIAESLLPSCLEEPPSIDSPNQRGVIKGTFTDLALRVHVDT